jgi:glutaredoxin
MKRVEIYTKSYCPFCQRAKELLRIKGVAFIEHDVTTDLTVSCLGDSYKEIQMGTHSIHLGL